MESEVKRTVNKEQSMPHVRTPMALKMDCLNQQGFDKEFMITDDGLKCIQTNEIFQPGDLRIIEHQRFEGISDPDDMAILYVIKTNSGLKGMIVDAFGIYGDKDLMAFMNQVKDETVENIAQILSSPCSF